jgi:hypothetical protein
VYLLMIWYDVHCLLCCVYSTTVNIYMAASSMHNPIQGQLCFCFVIMGTIHLLFNWKADIDILKMFQAWQHHAEREESKSSVYPYQVDFDEGIVIYGSASTDNNDLGSTVRAGMISSADSAHHNDCNKNRSVLQEREAGDVHYGSEAKNAESDADPAAATAGAGALFGSQLSMGGSSVKGIEMGRAVRPPPPQSAPAVTNSAVQAQYDLVVEEFHHDSTANGHNRSRNHSHIDSRRNSIAAAAQMGFV